MTPLTPARLRELRSIHFKLCPTDAEDAQISFFAMLQSRYSCWQLQVVWVKCIPCCDHSIYCAWLKTMRTSRDAGNSSCISSCCSTWHHCYWNYMLTADYILVGIYLLVLALCHNKTFLPDQHGWLAQCAICIDLYITWCELVCN